VRDIPLGAHVPFFFGPKVKEMPSRKAPKKVAPKSTRSRVRQTGGFFFDSTTPDSPTDISASACASDGTLASFFMPVTQQSQYVSGVPFASSGDPTGSGNAILSAFSNATSVVSSRADTVQYTGNDMSAPLYTPFNTFYKQEGGGRSIRSRKAAPAAAAAAKKKNTPAAAAAKKKKPAAAAAAKKKKPVAAAARKKVAAPKKTKTTA
jgi:hypothetical protein